MNRLTSIELCAGAGGQALGIERAGFEHIALVEIDEHCCRTLAMNRPAWAGRIHRIDLREFNAKPYRGVDLLAAGLPCPPFSKAGKQLGARDERNLFPDALRIVHECRPRAIMIENVRGILDRRFTGFREEFTQALEGLGYEAEFRLLNASEFGVPQLRPRAVLVATKRDLWGEFKWPQGKRTAPNVGDVLHPMMAANGWKGADDWRRRADAIAPTLVGGSKKHGGPDLGPTRAKLAWRALHVDAGKLALEAPDPDFVGLPLLTVPMAGLLQGFPARWIFSGAKTHAYRQVGNAFPPPVAAAVARQIARALKKEQQPRRLRDVA